MLIPKGDILVCLTVPHFQIKETEMLKETASKQGDSVKKPVNQMTYPQRKPLEEISGPKLEIKIKDKEM